MTPKSHSPLISRRSVVQVLMSIPALALFHAHLPSAPAARPDGFVEVNGWILKRSEVA